MTRKEQTISEIKAMIAEDGDFLRPVVRTVIQEFLEAEMAEAIGAQKGERVEGRLSYRSGYYPRSLITRVGKLELRVPQDRNGAVFHRDFRALSAQRKGVGGGFNADVYPRRLDPKGQSDQRGTLRAQL